MEENSDGVMDQLAHQGDLLDPGALGCEEPADAADEVSHYDPYVAELECPDWAWNGISADHLNFLQP